MISTIIAAVLLYLLVVVWQPLWTEGFRDFGKISHAIEELNTTAKPAVAVVPGMMEQMEQMNQTMILMDGNIHRMNTIMVHQMGSMNYQMNQMNDKFSPLGMMPFNW